MKLLKLLIILPTVALIALSSCTDDRLSIDPKNIVQDKDLYTTEDGVQAYMANMYRKLPVEDFRYSPNFVFNESWLVQPVPNMTGEAMGRDLMNARSEDAGANAYFEQAYNLLRNANTFLENFPQHEDNYTQEKADGFKGEAYFIRAFTHFALAKRYGGVPIVTKVLEYPEKSISELDKPRDSEVAVYDQISEDFDKAIQMLPEQNSLGRATKWAAASFKSRAMLHAGSIAKFHNESLFNGDTRIVGIPEQKAQDYFMEAFEAARMVQEQSPHQLYRDQWAANDPEAQYQNFVNMFFDKSSPENIFIKDYKYDDSVHGFDAYYVPSQLMGPNGYSAGANPTLEFVEMFDGIPKNDQGQIEVLNDNGYYKMFDKRMDFFENVEPRLRATVILPGDEFKGEQIDIRRGIYTKNEENISPLLSEPNNTTENYETFVDSLVSSSNDRQTPYTLENGEKMNPAGLSGIFYCGPHCGRGTFTGFSLRKYLKPDLPTAETKERSLEHHFIEMRYGEVLLNLAEAAFELDQLGAPGENYRDIAFNAINQIRERAGADLLQSTGDLTREVVRTERRKELAFERKIWWDLKRWRIIHEEQSNKRYRALMPFYSEHTGQYFFDARLNEFDITYDFDTRWYYQEIPGYVIEKSNITQNPGY